MSDDQRLMGFETEHIDDPALKAAVKQAFAGERAPAALRNRILSALDQASTPSGQKAKPKLTKQPAWVKYAAAAIVVLGLVAAWEWIYIYEPTPHYDPSQVVYTLPTNVRDDMVKAHKDPAVTQFTDREKAATELTARLHHKVLAPDIAGWTFKSAQVVSVGGQDAVRAVYSRNNETISVFSVICDSYSAPDGTNYEDQACSSADICLSGAIRSRMIYCVLASHPTPEVTSEIQKIRDEIVKGL